MTLEADAAREKYKKIRARFASEPPVLNFPGILHQHRVGRELEIVANGQADEILARLKAAGPEALTTESLPLEDIFLAALK
jgi:hypothetical protein